MATSARWELLTGTTVGLKAAMAVSGAVMSGWVLLHMAGNLLVFGGPELINGYGAALQGNPLVWVMRATLTVALAVHVGGAVVLWRRNRDARRERYRGPTTTQTSTASSRSMRWGGLAVGLFLLFHVLHIYGPLHADFIAGDVHHNLVAGLRDPIVGGVYVLSALVFGLTCTTARGACSDRWGTTGTSRSACAEARPRSRSS